MAKQQSEYLGGYVLNPTLRLEARFDLCIRGRGRSSGQIDHTGFARALWLSALKNLDQDGLRKFRNLGIFVRPQDCPQPVKLSCALTSAQAALVPYATRVDDDARVPAGALELNPAHVVQRKAQLPRSIARRVRSLDFADTSRDILWIENPGTQIVAPYALSTRLSRLVQGTLAPSDLSAVEIDVLRRADVLVPAGYNAGVREQWARRLQQAAEELSKQQYAVIRKLVNPMQLAGFRSYYRRLEREGYFTDGDPQVPLRKVIHNEGAARFLHHQLVSMLNRVTPERVKPSYAYLAIYKPGAVLPRHIDREQCAWNVSMVLDATPETDISGAWPIHVEVDGRPHAVRLEIGDAVIYRGTRLPHWRDAQPKGHKSTICFFHFVPTTFRKTLD